MAKRKLKTETDTPEMEERVRAAFVAWDGFGHGGKFSADFEHGQWWITVRGSGRQYSVHDAECGDSVDGFSFECVTEGEED